MSKVALRVYNREIETLVDQGHLEEAIAHCQHILKIFPKHLESYRLLGKAYLESRRYKDAADIFERVIASVPDDFVSQLGMSLVRDEQKDMDGAIWHMERAFEVNPSNGAVQGELRRLYGRRDGMEPPKIRLTRGALAQMYAKGGQYQQAIAEIKSVLSEDSTRLDMRILMARAFYRGGQKVEATDICMDLLKQLPFFLDANRILIDVLPGNQDIYRKRVEALEPYATQAKGSTFELDTVPDNAITIDRLEWDADAAANSYSSGSTGKANESLPDFLSATGWGPSTGEFQDGPMDFSEDEPASANAAGLAAADIPDWLKAMAPPGASAASEEPDTVSNQSVDDKDLDWLSGLGGPIASTTSQPVAPKNDQPDWLTDLGGDQSADLFESQTTSQNTSSSDQPDWLTELGAPTAGNAAQTDDDSLDWLTALHETQSTPAAQPDTTSATPQTDDAEMDWLQNLGLPQETASSTPIASQPPAAADDSTDMDWLQGLGVPQTESPAPSAVSQPIEQTATDDSADMDWLQGLGLPQTESPAASAVPVEQPAADDSADMDWLQGLGLPQTESPAPSAVSQPIEQTATDDSADMDWLQGLGVPQTESPAPNTMSQPVEQPAADDSADMDWLQGLGVPQTESPAPSTMLQPVEQPTPSDDIADADMDWLTNLGAPQAAAPAAPVSQPPPAATPPQPIMTEKKKFAQDDPNFVPPPLSELVSGPGTSESEQDDAMKWLEALAAKQGAKAEELITKPEDRTHDAPTWVAPTSEQPAAPVAQPPAPEPTVEKKKFAQDDPNFVPPPLSELVSGPGTSESEQDDAMKWLEALAAKQGAKAEELITKPEDRTHDIPTWAAPAVEQPAAPVAQTPPPAPEPTVEKKKFAQDDPNFVPPPLSELVSGPGTSESEQDDAMKWLEALAAKQGAKAEELITKPEDRTHDIPTWAAPAVEQPAAPVAQTPPPAPEPVVEKKKFAQDDPNFVPPPLSELVSGPGTSESEQDDAMKWLEALAAKQGAKAEELITKPEDRTHDIPTWAAPAVEQPAAPVAQTPSPAPEPIVEKKKFAQDDPNFVPPPLSELVSGPGTSESEQDDAMKWLEALAAKQGANAEELITKPEDRTHDMPTWAAQTTEQPAAPVTPTALPASFDQPTIVQKKKVAQDDPNFVPPPLSEVVSGPGTSESEQDDAMKWLEALAAKQGANAEELITKPEDRTHDMPTWAAQTTEQPAALADSAISASEQDDAMRWLESLAETQGTPTAETPVENDIPDWAAETLPMDLTPTPSQPEPVTSSDDTMSWLKNLAADEQPVAADQTPVEVPVSPVDFSAPVEPMPWEQEEAAAEPVAQMPWEQETTPVAAQAEEPADVSAWLKDLDAESEPPTTPITTPSTPAPAPVAETADAMPDWMNTKQPSSGSDDDLPDWLKDSSGDEQPGSPLSTPEWIPDADETAHLIFSPPLEKPAPPPPPAPAPVSAATRVPTTPLAPPPQPPAPVRPAVRQTGMLGDKDGPALQNARQLMAHGSMDSAINGYVKLIKRSKFLEEVIYDLKEATYSHPVDAIIWQTLGDAHMRANQLQEALDAYTRAEELIR